MLCSGPLVCIGVVAVLSQCRVSSQLFTPRPPHPPPTVPSIIKESRRLLLQHTQLRNKRGASHATVCGSCWPPVCSADRHGTQLYCPIVCLLEVGTLDSVRTATAVSICSLLFSASYDTAATSCKCVLIRRNLFVTCSRSSKTCMCYCCCTTPHLSSTQPGKKCSIKYIFECGRFAPR